MKVFNSRGQEISAGSVYPGCFVYVEGVRWDVIGVEDDGRLHLERRMSIDPTHDHA